MNTQNDLDNSYQDSKTLQVPASFEPFIEHLQATLPDMCTTADLVKAKIYGCKAAVCTARQRGDGPDYLNPSPKVFMYPKLGVIYWVVSRINTGAVSQEIAA